MRLSECYSLLEVAHGATLDEIKASYRKLAFKYHPDLNPGDTRAAQRFTRLNEAYVLLKKNLEADPSGKPRFNAETIRQLIETGLPGARATVQGEDGVHFEATVVSEAFRGKLPLARHRMVYATLGDLMGGAIHALQLKTVTPEEAG